MQKIYLDKIINFLFPSEHNYDLNIELKEYIYSNIKYKKGSEDLFVLCPPWHLGPIVTKILRYNLKKRNCSYLEFSLHQDIISCDYKTTHKLIKNSINFMKKTILDYKKKYNFKRIHFIGISLGGLWAINLCKEIKDIETLTLVTPGHSFSKSFWFGYSTRKMIEVLQANNIQLEDLKKEWVDIEIVYNLNKIKPKKIKILLSESDIVIPYEQGEELILELNKQGLKPKIYLNKNLGHYGTSFIFLLNPQKYLFD